MFDIYSLFWSYILDAVDVSFGVKLFSLAITTCFFYLLLELRHRTAVLDRFDARWGDLIVPPPVAPPGTIGARWAEIVRHSESQREAEWKFAIIEADKLVDDLLCQAGFGGAGLGERLMNIQPGQLTSLEGLWEAHKVRNKIAHEASYHLRNSEARRVIELYERTLKELNALDETSLEGRR